MNRGPLLNYLIHPIVDGSYDRARWLTIDFIDPHSVHLNLQDLCHPGHLTNLSAVRCPIYHLVEVMVKGCVQITTQVGYLLIRKDGDHASVEFRGHEDRSPTRALILSEDIVRRLQSLVGTSGSVAAM